MQKKKGFTLLEILLVVGIIAILAGIVIIAINPSKQLATVRNTQRVSDLKQLNNAITQYYIDKGTYPASTTLSTTTLTEICNTGSASATTTSIYGTPCGTLTNLSELVPVYLTAIPADPSSTSTSGDGYKVIKNTSSNQIATLAPLAELNVPIMLGNPPCFATGGTISTTTGYKIHTFTSGGTFTVTGSCNVEVLVVAGGGGGGSGNLGAGGGAGGLIFSPSTVITANSNTVTVGNGGASDTNGQNSSFGSLVAVGGGSGANQGTISGSNGGSGGGASYNGNGGAAGVATAGQGNNGGLNGATSNTLYYPCGGGGGAGGAGQTPAGNSSPGGNGGVGLQYSTSGTLTYYAGGGGGGRWGGGSVGTGGLGGGGNAGNPGSAGTPNTGGGGGGAYSGGAGGVGGSGIVIVKYAN